MATPAPCRTLSNIHAKKKKESKDDKRLAVAAAKCHPLTAGLHPSPNLTTTTLPRHTVSFDGDLFPSPPSSTHTQKRRIRGKTLETRVAFPKKAHPSARISHEDASSSAKQPSPPPHFTHPTLVARQLRTNLAFEFGARLGNWGGGVSRRKIKTGYDLGNTVASIR